MLQPGEIREYLVDRLTTIFGAPKNPEGLSAELAKHVAPGVGAGDLTGLADRLIATRKVKGFPAASELIGAVKAIVPTAATVSASGTGIEGEIYFDGDMPMTWILGADPRWQALCDVARAMEPRDKHNRPSRPYPMTSKYAPGVGRFFRAEHVRGVAVTDDDKRYIAGLYARAKREAVKISDQAATRPQADR